MGHFEILRKKSQHTDPDWIDRLLAKHEAVFTTDPPERTDELEEVKTPDLKKVYRHKDRTVFTADTMKRMLYERVGPQCWGCDFKAPAGDRGIKYLELDHVRPKSESNINHFYNRALLCGPCNREKSDKLQLNELRRQVYGSKKKAEAHPIDLEEAAAWTRQQELNELMRREREKTPLFGS